MSNGSLLPCLWTKTNPDSTWNVMFLISFSENILFSLAAKRRDREEREKKGGTKIEQREILKSAFVVDSRKRGSSLWGENRLAVSRWEEQAPKFAERRIHTPIKKRHAEEEDEALGSQTARFRWVHCWSTLHLVVSISNGYGSAMPPILQCSTICLWLQWHVRKTSHLPCLWINDRPCKIWKPMFRLTDSGKSFFLEA